MKQQLNEELHRMQKLAGSITEENNNSTFKINQYKDEALSILEEFIDEFEPQGLFEFIYCVGINRIMAWLELEFCALGALLWHIDLFGKTIFGQDTQGSTSLCTFVPYHSNNIRLDAFLFCRNGSID